MRPRFLLIWLCLILWIPASMANYYWVGGSGNWSDINHWATSSGGTTKHIVVPSPNDNVIFDHNSFTAPGQAVIIDPTIATARNFSIQNVQHTPTFQGGGQLKVYGSLQLSQDANWSFGGTLYFEAVTTGHTITTDGITISNTIWFQGIGGSWTLLDDLVCNQSIRLLHGSLNTNGMELRCASIISDQANQRGLILGSSTLRIGSTINLQLQNLNLNAGASTIYFTSTGTLIAQGAGPAIFHVVEFAQSGTINGTINYDTLRLSRGYSYQIVGSSNISGQLDAIGTCVQQIGLNGVWQLTMPQAAQFLVEYCNVTNIQAGGGALFVADESIDLGGNSGISFNPLTPFDLYWVGGSGEWSDTAHWSYVSGGPGGACIPRPIDDVWFDANSLQSNDSVLISQDAHCRYMRWVNVPQQVKLTKVANLNIHGSLWLHHNMSWESGGSNTIFCSNQPGETITTDQVSLTGPVYFEGDGSWTLLDDFTVDGSVVEHRRGHWNTNGMTVSMHNYLSNTSDNRTLQLGSSHFYVLSDSENAWYLSGLSYTLDAGTSTIDFVSPGAGMINNNTLGISFYHVIFSSPNGLSKLQTDDNSFHTLTFMGNGYINGNNTIGTLTLSKGRDYSLAVYQTQIILDQLVAQGGCDGYILLHSEEKELESYISKASGVVDCEFMIIWDIHAVGGATFNANNSVDIGGNIGWNFTSPTPQNLYWVGGSGLWSDVSNWSYSSGGPGGACVPSPLDSVFFDNNSFFKSVDTVYVDLMNATCHTMTWLNTNHIGTMVGPDDHSLWFWGSVIFNYNMFNTFAGKAWFEAPDTGHVITMAGNGFNNNVVFNGRGGSWQVTDTLLVQSAILLRYGALLAANKTIQTGALRSPGTSERTLDITNVEVTITGFQQTWVLNHDSLLFFGGGSHLKFESPGVQPFFNTSSTQIPIQYHNISFLNPQSNGDMMSDSVYVSFHVARFYGGGRFRGSFSYDSLFLSPGKSYGFNGGSTQTFSYLEAEGTCFLPISFTAIGSTPPPYYFQNLSPLAEVSHVTLQGCYGMPPSLYEAAGSFDDGGNTNWVITTVGPVDLYWVNGQGEWWDSTHWSYSSGGPGGACIPTWRDNVFFDQNSFQNPDDTVWLNQGFAECHDMQWINLTGQPTFLQSGVPLEIHGSLLLDTAINGEFNAAVRFKAVTTGHTIDPGGQVFGQIVEFMGAGGEWTIQSPFVASQTIMHTHGHLNTNSQPISARAYISAVNNTRGLTLGNSDVVLNNIWRINGNNMQFDAGQSHIMLTANTAQMISENGPGFDYHNVSLLGTDQACTLRCNAIPVSYNRVLVNNSAFILGEHTFDSLLFMPGNLYQLEYNKTQTINDYWLLRGNNCFPLTLQSTVLGQQATVHKPAGSVIGDFLHIRDIAATGSATFFAGDNSSDISNNTGWDFSNSPGYIFGLGPDIEFTIGTSVTLSTVNFNAGPGTTYLWSTGETTPSIIVTQPDTYYVTVTYAGNCVVVDSIIVFCNVKPLYTIGHNICYGDSTGWINVTIQDTVGTYTAHWSHGATDLNVSDLTSGQYIINIYGSTGCNGRDTLLVEQPPPVIAPLNDTSFCEDTPGILLDASPNFVFYWWDGQPGGQTHFVNQETTVVIMVEDADGCRSDPDTLHISIDTIPYIWLGEDAEICLGEQLILTPGPGFDSYLWQDGSTDSKFTATKGGTYHVTITLRTCTNHDTIYLFDCPPLLQFPNVFTPNADGYNDYFYPIHQNVFNYKLIVYNRWGTVVFASNDPYEKWDGTTNGHPVPDGTYFYTVEYNGFGQKATPGSKFHNGIVTVLR